MSSRGERVKVVKVDSDPLCLDLGVLGASLYMNRRVRACKRYGIYLHYLHLDQKSRFFEGILTKKVKVEKTSTFTTFTFCKNTKERTEMNIHHAKQRIEAEYDEPLADVVAGYFIQGCGYSLIAETLEVSVKSLVAYCKEHHLSPRSGRGRLQHGELTRRRISEGVRRSRAKVSAFGKRMSFIEWEEETGIDHNVLCKRISKGWSPSQALSQPVMSRSEAGRVAARARWARKEVK